MRNRAHGGASTAMRPPPTLPADDADDDPDAVVLDDLGLALAEPVDTLAGLDREIDKAAENFLRAPAEVLDLVGNKLTALKRQREHVQGALRAAQVVMKPTDEVGEVDAAVDRLWRLGEELSKAEPARRREVFRLLVERIEQRFDQVKQGKKVICPLQSCEILLGTGEGTMFFSVSRGDWHSFEPLIASYLDAALSPSAEVVMATRLIKLSA